mgnify:CR=1 FL=1
MYSHYFVVELLGEFLKILSKLKIFKKLVFLEDGF